MTFSEIASLLGSPLPASASIYQAWWANEQKPRPVQKQAWTEAGFEVAHVHRHKDEGWVRFKRRAY